MTDDEKRKLLDGLEKGCWEALNNLDTFGLDRPNTLRNLLTSIEIIKEMRYDYQEDDNEETEE